jgi:hypothetical protein
LGPYQIQWPKTTKISRALSGFVPDVSAGIRGTESPGKPPEKPRPLSRAAAGLDRRTTADVLADTHYKPWKSRQELNQDVRPQTDLLRTPYGFNPNATKSSGQIQTKYFQSNMILFA